MSWANISDLAYPQMSVRSGFAPQLSSRAAIPRSPSIIQTQYHNRGTQQRGPNDALNSQTHTWDVVPVSVPPAGNVERRLEGCSSLIAGHDAIVREQIHSLHACDCYQASV